MEQRIFRQAALEQLSSPEDLHTIFRVVPFRTWIVLIALGIWMVVMVWWSLVGRLPVKVQGQGILLAQPGVVEVTTTYSGQISQLLVREGDWLRKGQKVAHLHQAQLLDQLQNAQRELWLHPGVQSESVQKIHRRIRQLQDELKLRSHVSTPYAGRVVEIVSRTGQSMEPGVPVLRLELQSESPHALEVVLYLSPLEGNKVEAGMMVEVIPSTIKQEEHGFLLGKVKRVSRHPASLLGMMHTLKHPELARFLAQQQGTPIRVLVTLVPDAVTPTGYRWSSGTGPTNPLYSGTLCAGTVVLEYRSPFALMFLHGKKRWQQISAQR